MLNIALTDDDTMLVELLHTYLDGREELNVLFTAESGEELFTKLALGETLPEVLLLDLNMKDMDGIRITERLKTTFPTVRVIILSSHYKRSFLGFMLKTGVAAFLPKGISVHELPGILATVAEKGFFLLPGQMDIIREQISAKTPVPTLESENSLTDREIEVLCLLCCQKTAKEIGEQLFITQRTVEGHKNSLLVKTGVKNMAGLVVYAVQRGIIRVEDLPIV